MRSLPRFCALLYDTGRRCVAESALLQVPGYEGGDRQCFGGGEDKVGVSDPAHYLVTHPCHFTPYLAHLVCYTLLTGARFYPATGRLRLGR